MVIVELCGLSYERKIVRLVENLNVQEELLNNC